MAPVNTSQNIYKKMYDSILDAQAQANQRMQMDIKRAQKVIKDEIPDQIWQHEYVDYLVIDQN